MRDVWGVTATDDEGLFVDENPGDNIEIDSYAIGRLQRVTWGVLL